MPTAKAFITSGTTWAGVATDGSAITVECIGGGGELHTEHRGLFRRRGGWKRRR
jgi:hypothetical protein